jgi:hypothetical protein
VLLAKLQPMIPRRELTAMILGAAIAAARCGGGPAETHGSGGTSGATTTTGGTGGGAPAGPHLVVPAVIDLPYVLAGAGPSSLAVEVQNDGDAPLAGLVWTLSGDASIALGGAPASLGAGEKASLTLTFAGSPTEIIAAASLAVSAPGGPATVPVFAVAGDPGLGAASWEDVAGAGGVLAGSGVTAAMPAAPYPDSGSSFTDPSVRVFLPEGYRDRGAQDLVVHFHGFNATVAQTLSAHLYQQHLYASGSNAVLVVPQGPVNTPSGDFGKLMAPGGLARLVDEVLVLLYREGKITHPTRGDLVLTSHSGGYQAVATNLDPAALAPPVVQLDLFDSIYGYESTFESWTLGGGILRSNYTSGGGTLANNQAVAAWLGQKGETVATEPTQKALRDAGAVIDFANTSHDGSTRLQGAYGEDLRWKLRHSRRGPRLELREASAAGATATARWFAPIDEDVTGFVVERSQDGATWSKAAEVDAAADHASFPVSGGARVRVKAVTAGVAPADALASDTYRVDAAPSVLVVDGFDRILDGSFGGLSHDFAAIVGEAAGKVASISHRAITEDGFDLSFWPAVIWLAGDQSIGDLALTDAEQQALTDYVDGGGRLVMSGSEVAWELHQSAAGAAFLAHCFGAAYLADDSGSLSASGTGPLAGVGSFTYAGPNAPYAEDFPDALAPASGGEVLLEYGSGQAAAVGAVGKGALVGFPLELVDDAAARDAVIAALLAFVGG